MVHFNNLYSREGKMFFKRRHEQITQAAARENNSNVKETLFKFGVMCNLLGKPQHYIKELYKLIIM